jgi:hypothetical protein
VTLPTRCWRTAQRTGKQAASKNSIARCNRLEMYMFVSNYEKAGNGQKQAARELQVPVNVVGSCACCMHRHSDACLSQRDGASS